MNSYQIIENLCLVSGMVFAGSLIGAPFICIFFIAAIKMGEAISNLCEYNSRKSQLSEYECDKRVLSIIAIVCYAGYFALSLAWLFLAPFLQHLKYGGWDVGAFVICWGFCFAFAFLARCLAKASM